MMSCMLLLYLAASPFHLESDTTSTDARATDPLQSADPDALYAAREDLAKAREARAIWADRLARNPRDFEAAWKLGKALYWLGGHALEAERKALLEEGIKAGRAAVAVEPNRPEGHFWIAANMGALAESFGMRQGLKYRGDIKNELLIVLKLDPAFQHGSGARARGPGFFKVPRLVGGSPKKSQEHLRKPHLQPQQHGIALLPLGDAPRHGPRGRRPRGAPEGPRRTDRPRVGAEDREFKDKARRLIGSLK
jgi:hypothetical protein